MVTYGKWEKTRAALSSLATHTQTPFEVIVIDSVIYHTTGAQDDILQAAYDPNIIKANDGNTKNRGD